MNASEMMRRFREVELIDDQTIRRQTLSALVEGSLPWFWETPAASSYKYHNPYCCGKYGLWIHTKMVFTAYERLSGSYLEQGLIDSDELDYGRSAVLLHDYRKYGSGKTKADEYALSNHDLIAAEWIREETDLPEEVASAVESHMGAWYDGPAPETDLDELVHLADMTASTKNGTFGIYKPHAKIREYYPSLAGADL